MRRVWVTVVLSFVGSALLLPGSANAAQIVGSNLAADATVTPVANSTSIQSVQPTGNALPVVPTSAGVIVSIRLKHGTTGADPGTYGFRILSGLLPNLTARIPAEQPDVVWPANDTPATRTFIPTAFGVPGGTPKGIPISPFEYLGFVRIGGGPGGNGLDMRAPSPGGERRFVLIAHNSGSADYSPTSVDSENLIQYTVEPDADRDGFGDETQDKCPTDAATQSTCPVKKKCKKKKKRKGKKSENAAAKKKKKGGCKKKRKKKK